MRLQVHAMEAHLTLEHLIEREKGAWSAFVKGDPQPSKALFSRRDDVALANPWGPPARGWDRVEATLDAAAQRFRDGELSSFEVVSRYVTDELAVVLGIERGRAKVGGSEDLSSFALRVTTAYRLEDDDWKIVLRHADPMMAEKPANASLS